MSLFLTVQRIKLLEALSFATETQALKDKILAMTKAITTHETNESDHIDTFWNVLYDIFNVKVGQQRRKSQKYVL